MYTLVSWNTCNITLFKLLYKFKIVAFFFLNINIIPIVGSRFLDRAHYNEFVENRSKNWALMRRRLVLGVKNTQNQTTQRPKEKGRLTRGRELPTPLASQEPLSFLWAFSPPTALGDLCCYIPISSVHPPPTLVSYPCLSSSARPIGHSF